MNHQSLSKIPVWCACLLLASILFSCGSARNSSISSKNSVSQAEVDPLTPEERRKFNYYLLEAVRLKEKGETDAAYEMLGHLWFVINVIQFVAKVCNLVKYDK